MKLLNKKIVTLSSVLFGSLLLTACPSGGGSDAPEGKEPNTAAEQGVATLKFSPFTGEFPLPINLLFDLNPATTDFTLNIPSTSPPAVAGNQLDGWSTLAPIVVSSTKDIDPASLAGAVRIFRVCGDPFKAGSPTGTPLGEFIPGVDFSVGVSKTNTKKIIVKPLRPFPDKYDATSVAACPAGAQGNLNKGNTFIVVMTNAIKDTDAGTVAPSDVYKLSKNPKCFYRFASDTDATCPGTTTTGATAEGVALGIANASDSSQQSSENVRRLVNGQEALAAGISGAGPAPLNPADIILSFSYSPVAIDNPDSLTVPAPTPSAKIAGPTTVKFPSTWDVVKGAAAAAGAGQSITLFETGQTVPGGTGRVLVGKVTVPYYLTPPSAANPTAPLTEAWKANKDSSFNSNSTNLTFHNPAPVKTTDLEIPILAVVPATAALDNLPIAILQHGITTNRVAVAAIAEALAGQGIASISIDLPLHGIPPGDSFDFLRSDDPALAPLGLPGERTFDVDYVSNTTGAPGPDSNADASGTHFINLADLVVSRDNLRQAVSDLLTLKAGFANMTAIVPAGPGAGTQTVSFDASNVMFFGHSLGGIVGGTFLAQATGIKAASLAMPGAGIAKLLDASAGFGPRITAGLGANGVNEGTDDFESFLYFAQAAVDVTDPINHAANITVPTHVIEVVGGGTATSTGPAVVSITVPSDLVVPNDALNPQPGVEIIPEVGVGGTEALIAALGITTIEKRTAGSCNTRPAVPAPLAVQFDTGTHSTVAKPTDTISGLDFDFSGEFNEMLTEIGGFFKSVSLGGPANVPIDAGAACVPPSAPAG